MGLRNAYDGLITLPPSRALNVRRRPDFPPTPASDAQSPLAQPVHEIPALTLRLVSAGPGSTLWNEYVQRYHCLVYAPMSGSQLRYNVYCGDKLVALLSFGASAWKLAGRDTFIGWQDCLRRKSLHLVVNNARFLILPRIQCKGLASKILSIVNRQSPMTGSSATASGPCCLSPSCRPSATAVALTRQPTGSMSAKRSAGVKSPASTNTSSPSRTSGSTRCKRTTAQCFAPEPEPCAQTGHAGLPNAYAGKNPPNTIDHLSR